MKDLEHIPVMVDSVIESVVRNRDGFYLDCTFGAGGHTRYLLKKLSKKAKVLGIDVDEVAVNIGKKLKKDDARFDITKLNFSNLAEYMKEHNLPKADGVIFDLGLSSMQINDPERGFSYKNSTTLDMRMDLESKKTAEEILNFSTKSELCEIFKKYGEIRNPRRLVNSISDFRKQRYISSAEDFLKIIENSFPHHEVHYNKNPAKLCFQALRIETNQELKALESCLNFLHEIIAPDGLACFITFHSLEEKIIKNWIWNNCSSICVPDFPDVIENKFRFVNNRYIVPDRNEILNNWKSRSAKLWVFQRIKKN